MPTMALAGLVRRGLTPLLVVLVVAPPRVCTCEHSHALAPQVVVTDDDGDDDGPTPHHPPGPCPANEPNCPCVEPPQLKATVPTSHVAVAPPAASPTLFFPHLDDRAGFDSPSSDPGTGDPPLYLTGCALRF
jgi:hypothetical protein